ncbi:hypothetical protein V5F77_00500 [Xanthobacter sp. DSM 24535]|uniref:hypothetical protein n=1 Tax=Roseixanthobacter psychrophilus TaxID=3119917 RepID=UPI00372A0F0C
MFDQFSRYMICYSLIHNYFFWRHGHGPAPTLAALQRAVEASPRQTAGLVASLKAGRLVIAEPAASDLRIRLLRPSAEMIGEIGRSVLAFVVAADRLDGVGAAGDRLTGEADALGDLLYRSAAHVRTHGTLIHPFPRVLFFAMRDCGYLLLCKVMQAHYGQTVPQAAPGPHLSYRALAEALQVSPAHIGNLLGEAAREGWFVIGGRGKLEAIDPTLVEEFELWSSTQMAHYRWLGNQTLTFLAAPLSLGANDRRG